MGLHSVLRFRSSTLSEIPQPGSEMSQSRERLLGQLKELLQQDHPVWNDQTDEGKTIFLIDLFIDSCMNDEAN